MSAEHYQKAVDLAPVRGKSKLRGRALTQAELARVVQSLESGRNIDLRDGAVIAILRCGGIRRQEIVRLVLEDLDLETGELEIHHGKGDKYRLVYLTKEAVTMVKDWLVVRGNAPGALICPVSRGGKVNLRHFSADGDGIYKLVKARASRAGVKHFSPHDFRRTFCSDLLSGGEDVFTVQELAGHSSANTTAKYDRRGEARKRRAGSIPFWQID